MLEIKNTTQKNNPSLPFQKIKEDILGKNYEVSLVFIGDKLSRKLNKQYRQKNKIANILSFPLDKNSGEIFINLRRAEKDCSKFDRSYKNFVGLLLIHGLLHLKGYEHSSKMDKEEERLRKKFKV